jgi:hypothetical protein
MASASTRVNFIRPIQPMTPSVTLLFGDRFPSHTFVGRRAFAAVSTRQPLRQVAAVHGDELAGDVIGIGQCQFLSGIACAAVGAYLGVMRSVKMSRRTDLNENRADVKT